MDQDEFRQWLEKVMYGPNHVLMRGEATLQQDPEGVEKLLPYSVHRGSPEVFEWLLGMCAPGALERQIVTLVKEAVFFRNPGLLSYLLDKTECDLADPQFASYFIVGHTPSDGVRFDFSTLLGGLVLSHRDEDSCVGNSFGQAIRKADLRIAEILKAAGAPAAEALGISQSHPSLGDFASLLAD